MNEVTIFAEPVSKCGRPASFVWHFTSLCLFALLLSHGGKISAQEKSAPATSVPSLKILLYRCLATDRRINLRGEQILVITHPDGKLTTVQRTVVWRKDGRCLTLQSDSGGQPNSVIAEDGQWNTRYEPRLHMAIRTRAIPHPTNTQAISRQIHRILSNYTVRYLGMQYTAERRCHLLEFTPRDPSSRTIKLWLDGQTGTEIRREEWDRGNILSLAFYTHVSFPATIPDTATRLTLPAHTPLVNVSRSSVLHDIVSLRKASRLPIYQPLFMPAGYEFDSGEVTQMEQGAVTCLRYTNGLSTLTVQMCRAPEPRPQARSVLYWTQMPKGECIVTFTDPRLSFTVIGNLDRLALLRLAQATDDTAEIRHISVLSQAYGQKLDWLWGLRHSGMSLDTMLALLETARRARRPISEVLKVYRDGWGWAMVARHFRLNPDEIREVLRPMWNSIAP